MINEIQIFKNKVLIELLSDNADEFGLKFFVFDELVKEIDAFGNNCQLNLI
jgi:hypothetical protein